ncbi:MAG: hypothetical protein EZS28_045706 [Streblomastix strix]|uniref:Cleavage/polyadenylation specificity factor A subunit C-terminal domain-containing protein n=1 Tax=Streblomastix strix TaxID=222440 RepID=A0A5J4TKJ4_9EUKA|nr:MAG: hypothetical protein EZS28_045706 [Streblomastix strix]
MIYIGTSYGAIEAFIPIAKIDDVELLGKLEILIRKSMEFEVTEENENDSNEKIEVDQSINISHIVYSTLSASNPLVFRGRFTSAKDIIDGELIGMYPHLDFHTQDAIAKQLDIERHALLKRIDQYFNVIL